MRDPYSVLGVSPGASEDEIKQAYRNLAQSAEPKRRELVLVKAWI